MAEVAAHGKDVHLDGVSIRFGEFTAVEETDLTVRAGEFFSILGPSGCGKTTILRAISGFIEPSSGEIRIGGEAMRGVGPNRRPTAMIFQNLALFPLMTVWENVAFGLEMRGWSKKDRRRRAEELLELVALREQAAKKPGELSGGQRQRVAIARALAVEPSVLLLDEPLSALDLKLRQHMRGELKEIQRKTGVTFIYITHDQGEALTMSDRIAVMKAGVIEQVAESDRIYSEPATPFVATFVGESNVFEGRVSATNGRFATVETAVGALIGENRGGLGAGERAMLFVRPERMQLGGNGTLPNQFEAAFERRHLEGAYVNLFFERDGREYTVHLTNVDEAGHAVRGRQRIGFRPEAGIVLRAGEVETEDDLA